MLLGLKMQASPTPEQKQILSQWMGGGRVIWNAKCEQWKYESVFARKYLPVKTYAEVDASYAQFKDDELTPYLARIPAEILKSAANSWRNTMRNWMDPEHPQKGPARRKRKLDSGSIFLEKRLFRFDNDPASGKLRLFIGTKTNNIGYLQIKMHRFFRVPNSLRIRKKAGHWWVSFCYDDLRKDGKLSTDAARLSALRQETKESLESKVIGIDRGIVIAAQSDTVGYDYSILEKARLARKLKALRRYQKRMARQVKGSKRRTKAKQKVGRTHLKIANIRENFCHQTSHSLTCVPGKVIVMENLPTKNMTRRPKSKRDPETGQWMRNGASRKAGLNKKILQIGWYKLETFVRYKARKRGCLFLKISPPYSSQECADCDHIHPANRISQALFVCQKCGHRDNADHNSACVLKKRAINLILDSGTELSGENILFLSDRGRGDRRKTSRRRPGSRICEASKKKEAASTGPPEALPLQGQPVSALARTGR